MADPRPNYVERDPWVCPECGGEGKWMTGTALRPHGAHQIQCALGHTWLELPTRLMRWANVLP